METKELKKEEVEKIKNSLDAGLKKVKKEEATATLEEKRLLSIKEEINNDRLLDEYVHLYMNMVLSHASRLKINFDSIKELVNKELKEQ